MPRAQPFSTIDLSLLEGAGPITANAPDSVKGFQRKYQRDLPAMRAAGFRDDVISGLMRMEAERASRGQSVFGQDVTNKLLNAAQQRRAITQPPRRDPLDVIGNVASDLTSLVMSIPKLPAALVHEIEDLPNISQRIKEGGGGLEGILSAPGIRMIPGAYTARNLLTGDLNEAASHPLYTLLDVLPAAHAIGLPATIAASRPVAALKELTRPLAGSNIGQLVKESFGSDTRRLAAMMEEEGANVARGKNPALSTIYTSELDQLRQRAHKWAIDTSKAIPDATRREEITRALTHDSKALDALNLDDAERAAVERGLGVIDEYRRFGEREGRLVSMEVGGVTETYTPQQAARLRRIRNTRDRAYLVADLRAAITEPGVTDLDQLGQRVRAHLEGEGTLAHKKEIARGYVHALAANGYEVGDALTRAGKITKNTIGQFLDDMSAARSVGQRDLSGVAREAGEATGPNAAREVMRQAYEGRPADTVRLFRGTGGIGGVRAGEEAARGGWWTPSFSYARQYMGDQGLVAVDVSRKQFSAYKPRSGVADFDALVKAQAGDPVHVPNQEFIGRPSKLGKPAQTWLTDTRKVTEKSRARVDKQVASLESRVVPARWQPHVVESLEKKVRGAVKEHAISVDAEGAAEINRLLDERDYDTLASRGLVDMDELRKWRTEARTEWTTLRDQGINPVFIHRVGPGTARAIPHAQVTSIVPKPSQYSERIYDYTPAVDDLVVAVEHQGLELARERGSRAFLDNFGTTFGKTGTDLKEMYRADARRIASRTGREVPEVLESLIRREWVRFSDTEQGFLRGGKFKFTDQFTPEARYVPRHLARALERVAAPPGYVAALNPVIGLFRTSVLPFSIRWHTNNILGGAIMAAVEDPRVLLQIPKAYKFAREIRDMNLAMEKGTTVELSEATRTLLENMPDSMRASLGTLEYSALPDDLLRMKRGEFFGKMFDQARESRIGRAVSKGIQTSYSVNQMFDDMYRTAAYLSGQHRALGIKGITAAEAASRGEALAAKIMPRWNELTPMERSVFRAVFPFYSFLNHIIRYAYRYPHDHPFRTAVTGSLVRAEQEDFGTGLPQALMQAFFLGDVDPKTGKQTVIDIGAANPFRDLGDNLTVAGFFSQTNPIFKAALTQLGYDPMTKGPNLYDDIEYDPRTGGFRARTPNTPGLIGQVVTSVVPQAGAIAALLGSSSEFKSLMRTNPDAAKRMLLSQFGVPLLWRKVDVNKEIFKGELNRQQAQHNALHDALKSGDYSDARRYPTLAPYLAQLESLAQSGGIKQYSTPQVEQLQQSILTGMTGAR